MRISQLQEITEWDKNLFVPAVDSGNKRFQFPKSSRSVLIKDLTSYSITGTTSEQIIGNGGSGILIPANTIQPGDIIFIEVVVSKIGSASFDIRLYLNTSPDMTGAGINQQIALLAPGASTTYAKIRREIYVRATTQEMWLSYVSLANDIGSSSAAIETKSFDLSVDQYLLVNVDPNSINDIITLRSINVEIIRP